jgi:hypothetical protein
MRNALFVGTIALAAGCKPPPEAPTELNELSLYLFANFDAEDEEVVAVGLANLDAFLATQDLTANIDDRAASLATLDGANLGTIVPPADADPLLQANVAAWASSTNAFDAHKTAVSDPNQVCLAGDSTKYSARTFVSDLPCFESGECRTLSTVNESRTESVIASVWMDVNADFRMIALEDGRDVLVSRGNLPEKAIADNPDESWDQRYTIDAWIPSADGATTLRYYAMWSSATIGVGADTYAALVKSGIGEYFDNSDAWLTDGDCHTDRDRENDRP